MAISSTVTFNGSEPIDSTLKESLKEMRCMCRITQPYIKPSAWEDGRYERQAICSEIDSSKDWLNPFGI